MCWPGGSRVGHCARLVTWLVRSLGSARIRIVLMSSHMTVGTPRAANAKLHRSQHRPPPQFVGVVYVWGGVCCGRAASNIDEGPRPSPARISQAEVVGEPDRTTRAQLGGPLKSGPISSFGRSGLCSKCDAYQGCLELTFVGRWGGVARERPNRAQKFVPRSALKVRSQANVSATRGDVREVYEP